MQFFATVTRVIDADTFEAEIDVLNFKRRKLQITEQIRVADVDAYERYTEKGKEAKEELKKMIEGQEIFLIVEDEDNFGRLIAHAFYNDISIAEWIVDNHYGEVKFY